MQKEVVDSVMERIESNMSKYDDRMQMAIDSLVKTLNIKFQ